MESILESILVLTHVDDSGASLAKTSLEAVTAGMDLAMRLAVPLSIGVIGSDSPGAAGAARALVQTGARLLAVSGEAFTQARYSSDAAACEALCRAAQASIVIVPGCARFARVAAGVAFRVGGVIDTHITAIGGTDSVEASRWFYRQRLEAVIGRDTRPWFLLVDPGTHAAYEGPSGETAPPKDEPCLVDVEQIAVELPAQRTTVTGVRSPALSGETIRPDAKLLFVAGAGWTKKQPDGQFHGSEAARLILDFLRASGASLGSSKSLVDQAGENHGAGENQQALPFLTHLNQIGQTGSTPRHRKGLSTCCYGEEPHVVGWRFISERRAISLDPNCGWARGKADVVYVADAFQVIAELNRLLNSGQG
jgi:electron transfer flavoprotein alpha subunit